MSAETPAAVGRFTRRRLQFRGWRGSRPFWAGLFVMLGGLPIAYFPYANLQIGHLTLAMATTAGAGSLIIGVLLVVLGFSLWLQRHVRTFAGVAAILLALVSIPVSNFGGFLIGFLLALVGGAMAVAWVEGEPAAPQEPVRQDTARDPVRQDAPREPVRQDVTGKGGAPGSETAGAASAGVTDVPRQAGERDGLPGPAPAHEANGRHSAG
ncbi:DUF6114 domain-containing protein [Streptomyces sp. NPDC059477]|uniref:DUF6114 domain-containing protein n=1 Tax=Streptomyces sp. NPDC059477 TaxID=3346847 RepID=UPI0036C67572